MNKRVLNINDRRYVCKLGQHRHRVSGPWGDCQFLAHVIIGLRLMSILS